MTRIVINPSELRSFCSALQATANERERMHDSVQHAHLPELTPQIEGEVRSALRRCAHHAAETAAFCERARRDLLRRAERMELDLAQPSPSSLPPWQRQAFLLRRSPGSLPPWLRGRFPGLSAAQVYRRYGRRDSDRDGRPDWCDPPDSFGQKGAQEVWGDLLWVTPGAALRGGLAVARGSAVAARAGFAKLTLVGGSKVGASKTGSSFSTVRSYWTQTTHFRGTKVYQRPDLINPRQIDENGLTNLERMRKGWAPYAPDGGKVILHHMTQSRAGPMAEVTGRFHDAYRRAIHVNPGRTIGSGIERGSFRHWREDYWMQRAKDFKDVKR